MFLPQPGKSDEEIAAESEKESPAAPEAEDLPADVQLPSYDDDACFWAHLQLASGKSEAQVRKQLREAGNSPKDANRIVETAIYHRDHYARRAEFRASGRSMGIGCALLLAGLGLTFVSRMSAGAIDSPIYFVFTGFFVAGFGLMFRGFLSRVRKRS